MKNILGFVLWGLTAGILIPAWAQPVADDPGVYGDAILRNWVQPGYPVAAKQAKLEGEVQVEFAVELDGHVTRTSVKQSSNELFNDSALKAVQRWTFEPALDEGKPVVSGMSVLVPFRLAQLRQKQVPIAPPGPEFMPAGLKVTEVKVKFAPDPEYPAELEEKKLPGEVGLEFTVDADGKARNPKVLWASNAAFVEAALRSLEKTQFEPAHQGPVAKAGKMQYPAEFESAGAKRAEILEANHLTVVTTPAPETLPTPVLLIDPVYPRERLLAGERGSATAEFSVGEDGHVGDVTVVSATAPEYGAALSAAVEAWMFKPAISEGAGQPVILRVVHDFTAPDSGVVARLAAVLRPGGTGVGAPTGLDRKLKPLWRGFPVYPQTLRTERPTGEATIEFVIDRDGRARVPRIVSASRDEFGWAAATAISQWVFERPMKHNEPVDVRVSIPVSFPPPPIK